jgi:hypothetical protein
VHSSLQSPLGCRTPVGKRPYAPTAAPCYPSPHLQRGTPGPDCRPDSERVTAAPAAPSPAARVAHSATATRIPSRTLAPAARASTHCLQQHPPFRPGTVPAARTPAAAATLASYAWTVTAQQGRVPLVYHQEVLHQPSVANVSLPVGSYTVHLIVKETAGYYASSTQVGVGVGLHLFVMRLVSMRSCT